MNAGRHARAPLLAALTGPLTGPLAMALLAPLGGVLVLLGVQVWPGTTAAPWLTAAGALALLAGLALAALTSTRPAPGPTASVRGWLAAPYALFLLALGLYGAERALRGDGTSAEAARAWSDLARGGWVLSLAAGTVLHGFASLGRLAQRNAAQVDARRIRAAGAAGLTLSLLLLLVGLVNFSLAHLPWQWNVAYFKVTQPSEATLEVARTLGEPVQVAAFFRADSAVAPLVRTYFESLRAALNGPVPLDVQVLDADLQPALAEAYKARGNGSVVLRKGDLLRPIQLGETLERARAPLRTFDATFYAKLLELARPRQVIYLTVGHGERAERGQQNPDAALGRFRTLLQERNYEVKELGIGEGLAERVPEDAALVVVAGAHTPFLPGEADALRRWLDAGGRLLALLEPGHEERRTRPLPGETVEALLRHYGVRFLPEVQANDRFYGRRTFTEADHALLVTVRYESHPSVRSLRRSASQFPLLLLGAGALEATAPPPGLEAKPVLKGMPGTWADSNANFRNDGDTEARGEPLLGLAVAPKAAQARRGLLPVAPQSTEGPRLLVYADAELAGDLLLQNRANQLLVEDALAWLVTGEASPGPPQQEEDVRIRHAREDDWLWFYLPILGVPALVLGFGFVRVARARRRRGARR